MNAHELPKESMIIDELRQLATLSKDLESPPKARKGLADTKKNREALFEACRAGEIDKLRAVLDTGVPVNIQAATTWISGRSPLCICANEGWTEGLRELVERGADESKIEGYFKAVKAGRSNGTCLLASVEYGQADAFRFLFPLHSKEAQAEALSSVRHASTFMACEAMGLSARTLDENVLRVLESCMPALDATTDQDAAERSLELAAFDAAAKRLGLADDASMRDDLLLKALARDSVGLIQGLAKRSVAPDAAGCIEVVPSSALRRDHALARWVDEHPDPLFSDTRHTRLTFNDEAEKPIRAGLATACLMTGYREAGDLAYALMALAPLRKEAMQSDLGRHLIAIKAPPKLLRRLEDLGEDLASIRDDSGRNPLHRSADKKSSKTEMEELARLCPDWISQRDAKGSTPAELVDADRRAAMAVLFDTIGMRESLGAKRGKKTASAAKRRL